MAAVALPLSVTLDFDDVEEFERAFAHRVGEGVLFVPGDDQPRPGTRVRTELKLKGGEVVLAFEGHVAWRYPPDAVPPGREAGVGLTVETLDDGARERMDRMRAADQNGARVRAPGTTLVIPVPGEPVPEPNEAREAAAKDDPPAPPPEPDPVEAVSGDDDVPAPPPAPELDDPFADTLPSLPELAADEGDAETTDVIEAPTLKSADFIHAEHEDRLEARKSDGDEDGGDGDGDSAHAHAHGHQVGVPNEEETSPLTQVRETSGPLGNAGHSPSPRDLPDPLPWPATHPLPLPDAYGAAFRFRYSTSGYGDALPNLIEPFAWPRVGNMRASHADVRTHVPGHEPPPAPIEIGRPPPPAEDELFNVATGGWDEPTDSDRAVLEGDGELPPVSDGPPAIDDDDEDEPTLTDADVDQTLSSDDGEPVQTLKNAILAGEHGFDAEELVAADTPLPAHTVASVAVSPATGRAQLVLLERVEGAARTLGEVRFPVVEGQKRMEAHVEVGADGWLTVWRVGDDEGKKRVPTSWAEGAPHRDGAEHGLLTRIFRFFWPE